MLLFKVFNKGSLIIILRVSSNANNAFRVNNTGNVNNNNVYNTSNASGVHPVLNLSSGVSYNGGTGTASDPYRII